MLLTGTGAADSSLATVLLIFKNIVLEVMDMISDNPLLLVIFVASLFFMGCSGVKALKKVAKK